MEKQAKIRSLPFLTSLATAQKLYAIDISEDEFIEYAYPVWRDIGNIAPVIKRFYSKVPDDFIVELPNGCEFIEGVTLADAINSHVQFHSGGKQDGQLNGYSESDITPRQNESITSMIGQSVNYETLTGAIKITSPYAADRDIMIVYKSILTGEDGLPLLNDKEIAAIAAEVARILTTRYVFQGIVGKDKLLGTITATADRLMAAAKVDEYINDDALDQLLDQKSTWDMKTYGSRMNLIK